MGGEVSVDITSVPLGELSEGWGRRSARSVLRIVVSSFGLLFTAFLFCFLLFSVLPSDPARVMLGPNASQDSVESLREELGLNDSLVKQLTRQMGQLVTLDFGRSIRDGRPVLPEVFEKFGVTIGIGIQATTIALLVSYLINLIVFLRPKFGWLIGLVGFGVVAPAFLLAMAGALLIGYFFPGISLTASAEGFFAPLVPSAIASLYPIALMTRILRKQVEECQASSFFRAAIAVGHSKESQFHRFALQPSLVPWLAAWINQLSLIFFATLVLELIFSISGSGVLLVNAIQDRDFPILQGVLLVNAVFFIGISTISEIVFARIDPRL